MRLQRIARRFPARANGADIALLPEVWSHGYTFPNAEDAAAEAWRRTALGDDSEFVRAYRDVAAECGLAIGLTYLEAHPSGPRNALALIDGSGEIVLRYAKVHTCEFSNERLCAPGEGFSVTTLETDKGPLEVGAGGEPEDHLEGLLPERPERALRVPLQVELRVPFEGLAADAKLAHVRKAP